jgi:hypothetical protein
MRGMDVQLQAYTGRAARCSRLQASAHFDTFTELCRRVGKLPSMIPPLQELAHRRYGYVYEARKNSRLPPWVKMA